MTAALGVPPPVLAAWAAAGVGVLLLILLGFAVANRVLLRMALRNIPRRRAQTALIVVGLMLASLLITAALAVGDTLTYSLQSIVMRQVGGIDQAVVRVPDRSPVGAGTTDASFFTADQAAAVIADARSDHSVALAAGLIAAPGAVSDSSTGQASSENVVVFGLPNEFDRLWANGGLRSRSGGSLSMSDLAPREVFVGSSLADRLGAHPGDSVRLFVEGRPLEVRVRNVLDTEVNPTIATQGPITGSVLLPLASMRTVLERPTGFNLVYIHDQGSGGVDDLGPNGASGQEIVQHLRGAFTDEQGADELKAYLQQPAIRAQIHAIHDQATFLDPDKELAQSLLVELDKPVMTVQFKALVGDPFEQRVIQRAAIEAAPNSSSPSVQQAASMEVQQRLAALNVNSSAAVQLRDMFQSPAVRKQLTELRATMKVGDPASQALDSVLSEPATGDVSPRFKLAVANPRSRPQLRQAVTLADPALGSRFDLITSQLQLDFLYSYKADGIVFAQFTGLIAGAALLGVSFFSLAVGVLLIFLIFVMLAAERRAEMGMSRAVGLKRRHLTQMFLFEGMAYTLGASAVGAAAGVGVGRLMIGVISSIFTSLYTGLDLIYHIEWPTLVIALCLGIALTFAVVVVSAQRVSRLNVVAAIRDLDEGETRDRGLGRLGLGIFSSLWASMRQLFRGHPLVFLGRLTFGTGGAIAAFIWGLFRRGPLTVLSGLALAAFGLTAQSEVLYGAGVSLLVIGAGLLIRWLLAVVRVRPAVRARIGFTAAAVGLLVYWGRPFGRVESLLHLDGTLQLSKLTGGAEVFALTALMVLLGAIWAVMYNSDLLIAVVMLPAGRAGRWAASARTSLAYPMSTKFRTGMAVAMFAIVTFMIAYMAIFKDVLGQNFADVNAQSGGWQLVAGSPDRLYSPNGDTTVPSNLATTVRADTTVSRDLNGIGWESGNQGVSAALVGANGAAGGPADHNGFSLHVVDDGYLNGTGYAIQPRAEGYADDRAVWNAVRDHVGYAVIDSSALDARGSAQPLVSGVRATDQTFKPFQLELSTFGFDGPGPQTPKWRVTVIGFMNRPIWDGLYVSTRTALASGSFSPPPAAGSALASPGTIGAATPLTPTGYYFSLQPGVDVNRARLDLGRLLVKDQLEPVSVADQQARSNGGLLTLLNLLTGFLALGLVVGIAGLGVISTRAVVERRQQIGMMRALGFRRSQVQRAFLMESSFVALLGLVIGSLVGLWQSYRFFITDRSLGDVAFHVPVLELALILLGSYLATLLTTYLPARAAARIAPAEALRFE
jgi:putative ABC transport system permease protein